MPPSDASRPPPSHSVARTAIIAIALVGVAALLWLNRTVIVLVFGAIIFATLIHTLGAQVSRLTRLSHRWGVLLAVLLLVAGFAGISWFFGASISRQFMELKDKLPEAIEHARASLEKIPGGPAVVEGLQGTMKEGGMGKFGLAAQALVEGFGLVLLIVFSSVYFALDPGLYRRGALRLLPPRQRPHVARALDESGDALRRWLRGQLVLMAAVGTLTGIGLQLVGVPLAFPLAIIIGLFEFVPLIGPFVGAVPGVLLAFTQGPDVVVAAVIVYVVVQQIENNVLTPLIQRWAVELPPVVALFSILIGGTMFGVLGLVFATPLAVVVMVLVQNLYVEDTLEKGKGKRE